MIQKPEQKTKDFIVSTVWGKYRQVHLWLSSSSSNVCDAGNLKLFVGQAWAPSVQQVQGDIFSEVPAWGGQVSSCTPRSVFSTITRQREESLLWITFACSCWPNRGSIVLPRPCRCCRATPAFLSGEADCSAGSSLQTSICLCDNICSEVQNLNY